MFYFRSCVRSQPWGEWQHRQRGERHVTGMHARVLTLMTGIKELESKMANAKSERPCSFFEGFEAACLHLSSRRGV